MTGISLAEFHNTAKKFVDELAADLTMRTRSVQGNVFKPQILQSYTGDEVQFTFFNPALHRESVLRINRADIAFFKTKAEPKTHSISNFFSNAAKQEQARKLIYNYMWPNFSPYYTQGNNDWLFASSYAPLLCPRRT